MVADEAGERGIEIDAKAELRGEPDEGADGEDEGPGETLLGDEQERSDEEEEDVHGEDVEQGRAIDEEDGADGGDDGMGEVEGEQVVEHGAVEGGREEAADGEGEGDEEEMVGVDAEGAGPESGAEGGESGGGLGGVDFSGEQGGEKDEAFGGGDKSEGLVGPGADGGGEVGEGHPEKQEAAESVELGLTAVFAEVFARGDSCGGLSGSGFRGKRGGASVGASVGENWGANLGGGAWAGGHAHCYYDSDTGLDSGLPEWLRGEFEMTEKRAGKIIERWRPEARSNRREG